MSYIVDESLSRDGSNKKHQNKGSRNGNKMQGDIPTSTLLKSSSDNNKVDVGMSPCILLPFLLPLFLCFLLLPSLLNDSIFNCLYLFVSFFVCN